MYPFSLSESFLLPLMHIYFPFPIALFHSFFFADHSFYISLFLQFSLLIICDCASRFFFSILFSISVSSSILLYSWSFNLSFSVSPILFIYHLFLCLSLIYLFLFIVPLINSSMHLILLSIPLSRELHSAIIYYCASHSSMLFLSALFIHSSLYLLPYIFLRSLDFFILLLCHSFLKLFFLFSS